MSASDSWLEIMVTSSNSWHKWGQAFRGETDVWVWHMGVVECEYIIHPSCTVFMACEVVDV